MSDDLLAAAKRLIEADVIWHEHSSHFCAVCGKSFPTKDSDHEPDCEFIALKRAVASASVPA